MKTKINTTIGILPTQSDANAFLERFTLCFSKHGFDARSFNWRNAALGQFDVAIFHWPNMFFCPTGMKAKLQAVVGLMILFLSKFVFGTKYIWVAHNVAPHDSKNLNHFLVSLFFRSLSGIIYISKHSKSVINEVYPAAKGLAHLVTRHGHYRDLMDTPTTPAPKRIRPRLVYFGQVRPYKNIEAIIELIAKSPDKMELLVAGTGNDKDKIVQNIKMNAAKSDNIFLNIQDKPLSNTELEKSIDSGDAVVLPYKNILNSGSVFLALSRNRPVLAPHVGSLPELQENVGKDWLHLYHGELTVDVLETFIENTKQRPQDSVPNLSCYEWNDIEAELCDFVKSLLLLTNASSQTES